MTWMVCSGVRAVLMVLCLYGFGGMGGDRRGEYGMGKGFGVKKLKFS